MYSTRKRSDGGCLVRRMIWAPRAASSWTTEAPMPDVPPYKVQDQSIGYRFEDGGLTVTITTLECINRSELLRAPPK